MFLPGPDSDRAFHSAATERVEPVVFTTDTFPPGQRLEAWNAQFGTLNRIAAMGPDPAAVSTRTENWLLGDMLLNVSRTSPAVFTRSAAHVRRDGLDHWVVRMVLRGRSSIEHGGAQHVIEPGVPVLLRLDAPWETVWEDAAWISLCLPRDSHPALAAALAARGAGPVQGEGSAVLADYMALLERQVRGATPARLAVLAGGTAGMLAACLAADGAPARGAPDDIAQGQFQRLQALIRQHMHSPRFNPQRLAALAGMSRSALYRLFESQGGVAQHIQAMRLRRALALLSDPGQAAAPIAVLAERSGFHDPSAFSRAFRTAYGCSPRDARIAALAGRAPVPPALPDSRDYGALLRGIGQVRAGRLTDA
ncbi:helix-turn-helix domain-containing protein [Falsiroseomonas bella]|nr:helix-turn-helix domain-containing protein [Falsiroseomonas bella]